MDRRFALASTARLVLDVVFVDVGTTGASPTVAIQRLADGKWFDASDSDWHVSPVDNAMVETNTASLPGRYHFDFDQSTDAVKGSTDYVAKYVNDDDDVGILVYDNLFFGPVAAVTSPELCSVQGSVFDGGGVAADGVLVVATLVPTLTDTLGRGFRSDRLIRAYTNEAGFFDLPLVRGGTYKLEIEAVGYVRRVVVPDAASVLFTAL